MYLWQLYQAGSYLKHIINFNIEEIYDNINNVYETIFNLGNSQSKNIKIHLGMTLDCLFKYLETVKRF